MLKTPIPGTIKNIEGSNYVMTRQLGSVSLIISLSLIVSSSFATSTPPQDVPAKSRRSQTAAQQQPEEGQPAPEVFRHWQALTVRNAEPVSATWNKRSGTPQSIVGKISRPAKGATEAGARSFLRENAGLFRMRNEHGRSKSRSRLREPDWSTRYLRAALSWGPGLWGPGGGPLQS